MRSHSIPPAKLQDTESTKPERGSFVRTLRKAKVALTREVLKGRLLLSMSNHESSQGRINGSEDKSKNGIAQDDRNKSSRNGMQGKAKKLHNQLEPEHHSDRGMKDMIRIVDSARRSMAEVEEWYDELFQDIQDAVQNRKRVVELETKCQQKDHKIDKQQDALDSILERSGKKDEQLEQKKLVIIEAEKELERKKADVDKFKAREEMKAKEADLERGKANDAQLKKQRLSLEHEFKELKGKLEKELKQREEAKQKKMAELEAENKRLSGRVKVLETDTKGHVVKLAAAKERCEDMEKLKKLSKEEATESQIELQRMKDEFGLKSNTPEFFQKKFGELSSLVHTISEKFCQELNSKDWSSIRNELKAVDPSLASIPISDSEESKLLRVAHAERIISFHLSELIFMPFSSDVTYQPERQIGVNMLEDVVLGLEESGESKRSAAVFKSLAVRGLQSFDSLPKPSSTHGTRTEAFLLAVMPVLYLLAPKAQHVKLKDALSGLVQSAISLWTLVQSDEFVDIKVSLNLDPNLRSQWTSSDFDLGSAMNNSAVALPVHSKILAFFPAIIAKVSTTSPAPQVHVPGSFDDSKPRTHVQTMCIHPGIGLPEISALVLRGEQEILEMEKEMEVVKLRMSLEASEKALSDRSKIKLQRNGTSPVSPSPTAEWGMVGGLKKSPEE